MIYKSSEIPHASSLDETAEHHVLGLREDRKSPCKIGIKFPPVLGTPEGPIMISNQ